MLLDRPTVCVIGAGAVGCYYGGRLAQHGFDVHFLLRSEYDAVRQHGLSVRSCHGDFHLPPGAIGLHNDPRAMPKGDLVLVTLKTTANRHLRELVEPVMKDHTAVLTLQNGLGNEEQLAGLFGKEKVLGGMAFVCINRIAPGVVHHMDHGLIRLGEFDRPAGERARRICQIMQASNVRCEVLADLRYGRWEKLVWNIPFNGLGAAMDLTTDRLIMNETGTALVREVMEEVIAAAGSVGVKFPDGLIGQKIEHTRTMGPYRSSMQVDRQTGRPMEIEAIVGEPLKIARRSDVATPRIEMIYRMLKAIDGADVQ